MPNAMKSHQISPIFAVGRAVSFSFRQCSARIFTLSTYRVSHQMNKNELIDSIAADSELSKAAAKRAVDSLIANVIKAVKKGDSVQLIGFGTFGSGKRAARVGRNPRTGEEIKIKAA